VPLRRWWTQNWFKPIAQIGKLGNDQYVLGSADDAVSATPGAANSPGPTVNCSCSLTTLW